MNKTPTGLDLDEILHNLWINAELFQHKLETAKGETVNMAIPDRQKAKAKQALTRWGLEQRIDEREIAIAQLDGVYQACVRDNVLTEDGLNGYHCAIEDACKDRDDRIAELQANLQDEG